MSKRLVIYPLMALALSPALYSPASAAEQVYKYPDIKTEHNLGAGYRLVDSGGSSRAGEYWYLKDSLMLNGSLVSYPFPSRLHLEFDVINKRDYFGDMRYAYKDAVLLRWVRRGLYHNLDNIGLFDRAPATASPGIIRRDEGVRYGIRAEMDDISLRLKAPEYPLHFFARSKFFDSHGDVQQRFIGGSGWFNDIKRVSEKRSINYRTRDIIFGANGHIGPVEAELSHEEKRFKRSGGEMSESYSGAGFPAGSVRQAGVYPHNFTPEIEGSSTSLKLHTSHTGRVSAAMTLTTSESENISSRAKSERFIGSAEVVARPVYGMDVALKYKTQKTDNEIPETLPENYLGFSSYSSSMRVAKRPIDSRAETVSGIVSYRPAGWADVRMGYTHEKTERENHEQWGLPNKTSSNAVNLSGGLRLPDRVRLRASYEHKNTNSPANNMMPERSDTTSMLLSWHGIPRLSTSLSLRRTDAESGRVKYHGAEGRNRKTKRNKTTANVSYAFESNITAAASYSHMENKVMQDLYYGLAEDKAVSYKEISNIYSITLGYNPAKKFNAKAGASKAKSRGGFSSISNGSSFAHLSRVNTQETSFELSADYKLSGQWNGWATGFKYGYSEFDNLNEDPENPSVTDGDAQYAMLTASKSW